MAARLNCATHARQLSTVSRLKRCAVFFSRGFSLTQIWDLLQVTSEAPVAAPPAAVVVGQSAALAGQAPQGAPEAQIKSATPASLASSTAINADQYWPPFKLALQNPNPKIVETALDCVQKLVAHRYVLRCLDWPLLTLGILSGSSRAPWWTLRRASC